jgi:predicted lipid-binding transport protein (Tim44 family)
MGDLPQYFDIILFAMVAAFLILRLRSVLGRRTGNERRPESLTRPADPCPADPRSAERAGDKAGNVVPLGVRAPASRPPLPTTKPADAAAAGIERVRSADPGFDPAAFLEGARTAFEMIVAAFAAGDRMQLRPLLSDEVYKPFSDAIDERETAGETLESRILRLKSIDITEAGLAGRIARVTVKFVSDQINVLRAHDGSIVDGHPEDPAEKTDFWTFARDTRSGDPNWVLEATASG